MDGPAQYLSWNFILISIPNILVIAAMIVVLLLALLAPFPDGDSWQETSDGHDD